MTQTILVELTRYQYNTLTMYINLTLSGLEFANQTYEDLDGVKSGASTKKIADLQDALDGLENLR
jgi:hypothetical protein